MKHLLLGLVALAALGCTPTSFTIQGTCKDPQATGVVKLIAYNAQNTLDTLFSVPIEKGKFVIKGQAPEPYVGYLLINDRLKDYIPVFVENAKYKVQVEGNVVTAFSGTPDQDVMGQYLAAKAPMNLLLDEFRMLSLDDRRNDSIKKAFQARDAALEPLSLANRLKVLEENPASVAGPLFFNLGLRDMKLDELRKVCGLMQSPAKESSYAKKIFDRLARLESLEIGGVAADFSMPTPEGEMLRLHTLPGKIKIVDFWASWCYPCRKENPFMKELYKKYHSQGLEILGVSLDDDREKWVKAIAQDGLPWPQVSELNKWKNSAVALYDVRSVPHTVILDAQNRILARNVRGEALEKLVAEALKAQ